MLLTKVLKELKPSFLILSKGSPNFIHSVETDIPGALSMGTKLKFHMTNPTPSMYLLMSLGV